MCGPSPNLELAMTSPTNPYVAGRALGQDQGFFGRDDVFEHVVSTLRSPDQNAVVLAGQRRIGKTSILLQLQRRLPSHGFVLVYFDLMDRAKKPLARVLYEWAVTIARQVDIPPPQAEAFDDDGEYFQSTFLPSLYHCLHDERRPVLLLDEFDVLDVAAEEQLPPGVAARAFFPYLRKLLATEPRLGFVFVIGRKAEDLSIQVKATFKGAHLKRVSVLDERSARDLITLAQRQESLAFVESAVTRILEWTAGHPYLTQLLCQVIWERAYRGGSHQASLPQIEITDVEAALTQALEQGEHVFEWIWDGLPPAERLIFAAIAEGTDGRRTVRTEDVMHLLQGHGIRILTRELELAPDLLVQWQMLSRTADGYRFPVEMLRLWVLKNKPLSRVKEELDRIVPLADSLYRSADAYYRNGKLDDALEQLRKALHANPNHLKARLRIGEILQEQGKLTAAIEELEHAYRYDEDAARYPLLRALLLRGEELERSGLSPPDLLAFYGRILELSPAEPLAIERSHELLRRIAEEHEAAGRLQEALTLYQQIGDADRQYSVRAELDRRQLAAEVKAAKTAEQRGDWQGALDVYERLLAAKPGEAWRAEVDRCRIELKLADRYTEAIGALNQGLWEQSQRALVDIVTTRPDYRDATERLSEAVRRARPERNQRSVARKRLHVPIWAALVWSTAMFAAGLLGGLLTRQHPSAPPATGQSPPAALSPVAATHAGMMSAAPSVTFPDIRPVREAVVAKPVHEPTAVVPDKSVKPEAAGQPPAGVPPKLETVTATPAEAAKPPAPAIPGCQCDSGEACTGKGNLQRKANPQLALLCYFKACKLNYGDGCSWAGYLLKKKNNYTEASRFFNKACRLNDMNSCVEEMKLQK